MKSGDEIGMDYEISNAFLNLGCLGFATFNNIRQGA
jgi:hypothetical protein